MVGHSPTNIHMGAYVSIANVSQHNLIFRINLNWDKNVFSLYPLVKDLNTTIQKMTKSIDPIMAKFGALRR
jgi:hypothetical protein